VLACAFWRAVARVLCCVRSCEHFSCRLVGRASRRFDSAGSLPNSACKNRASQWSSNWVVDELHRAHGPVCWSVRFVVRLTVCILVSHHNNREAESRVSMVLRMSGALFDWWAMSVGDSVCRRRARRRVRWLRDVSVLQTVQLPAGRASRRSDSVG
jgi:hypothetical protein